MPSLFEPLCPFCYHLLSILQQPFLYSTQPVRD
ncbi:hypothetical protein ANRL1_03943 [Anaerolineae bacterium]|nr:hypothetical protein ANRL1_03943 [Anaerolineae bacterium]